MRSQSVMQQSLRVFLLTPILLVIAGRLTAEQVEIQEPIVDRWMYPFNATPGTRAVASIFGTTGSEMFDDRDAQFVVVFDTTSVLPTGLPPEQYLLHRMELRLVHSAADTFLYDPTADPYDSYGDEPAGLDPDPGRPIELYGLGFRNGFTVDSFQEDAPYGPPGPPAANQRNAFAMDLAGDGTPADVSNNISAPVASQPWAIGITDQVDPGAPVPADTTFTFTLDLSRPELVDHIRNALAAGRFGLVVTSMHAASQGGAPAYPVFYTKENIAHAPAEGLFFAPRLILDVETEPILVVEAFYQDADGLLILQWNDLGPGVAYTVEYAPNAGSDAWQPAGDPGAWHVFNHSWQVDPAELPARGVLRVTAVKP